MKTWSVDVVGLRGLLEQVDADALEIDEQGESLARAVDDAIEAVTLAERGSVASALSAFFDDRVRFPQNLLGYIAAATEAVSAATVAIQDSDETMALDIQAAEMAAYWDVDDAVERIAGEG